MPARIDECWTIEGAQWVQRIQTGQTVDLTEDEILELEVAARHDWWARGSTPQERRASASADVKAGLKRIGTPDDARRLRMVDA